MEWCSECAPKTRRYFGVLSSCTEGIRPLVATFIQTIIIFAGVYKAACQMTRSETRFAQLLTVGVHRIRIREEKTIRAVQDELGYTMGRDGGSSIEYWRKGHIPLRASEVENLAREIVKRGHLDQEWLEQFLRSAGYPGVIELIGELFVPEGVRGGVHAAAHNGSNGVRDQGLPVNDADDHANNYDGLRDIDTQRLIPFVIGPPIVHPRQFFGREYELRRIFGLLKHFPLQNAAIIGPHRSGKTSLLHYLKHITSITPGQLRPGQRLTWLPNPEQYTWIFIDFQDARMCNLEFLLRSMLTGMRFPVPSPCNLNNFMDVVSHRLCTPTVVLMDEIGAGLQSPELDQQFWWSMRSLCSNLTGGNLSFILTAHDLPDRVADQYGKPSPFFNIIGHTLTLGPLTEAEACDLISSSPQPFPFPDVEWILEQSGRWPALLQILCYARLLAFDDGCTDDTWKEEALRSMAPYRYLLARQQ